MFESMKTNRYGNKEKKKEKEREVLNSKKHGKQKHMARLVSVVKSVAAVKWLFAHGLETVKGWTIASRQYILDLFWCKLTLRVRSESLDRSLSCTLYVPLYVPWITILLVRNFLPFYSFYHCLIIINNDPRIFPFPTKFFVLLYQFIHSLTLQWKLFFYIYLIFFLVSPL